MFCLTAFYWFSYETCKCVLSCSFLLVQLQEHEDVCFVLQLSIGSATRHVNVFCLTAFYWFSYENMNTYVLSYSFLLVQLQEHEDVCFVLQLSIGSATRT